MSVETAVQEVLNQVIEISAEELKPDAPLELEYGVDSTEMVEISVALKRKLNVPIGDNELKKSHSFNDIVNLLKTKVV